PIEISHRSWHSWTDLARAREPQRGSTRETDRKQHSQAERGGQAQPRHPQHHPLLGRREAEQRISEADRVADQAFALLPRGESRRRRLGARGRRLQVLRSEERRVGKEGRSRW